MDSSDLALIHMIELTTRKLISGPLLGDARSALKGSGFEFHQLRDYVQGDDIRFIDWKSSARSNKMLVRQYLEDRNRTVYIVVDVSASTHYGTGKMLKSDLIKQLGAILSFVSLHKKDSVGLLLFTKEVEKVVPPRQGRAHVFSLVKTLMHYQPKYPETRVNSALEYLARLRGQKALVCLISDFMDTHDTTLLSLVGHKHDLLLFRCLDEREREFPEVGTLMIEDSETKKVIEIGGSERDITNKLIFWHKHKKEEFNASRVDSLDLTAGKPFSGDLVRFLRTRIYG